MGHMDDSNETKYTISVRWKSDSTPEVFMHATNADTNGDEVSFDDNNGRHHEFSGVSYHIATE
jgi:hypothetical protein